VCFGNLLVLSDITGYTTPRPRNPTERTLYTDSYAPHGETEEIFGVRTHGYEGTKTTQTKRPITATDGSYVSSGSRTYRYGETRPQESEGETRSYEEAKQGITKTTTKVTQTPKRTATAKSTNCAAANFAVRLNYTS